MGTQLCLFESRFPTPLESKACYYSSCIVSVISWFIPGPWPWRCPFATSWWIDRFSNSVYPKPSREIVFKHDQTNPFHVFHIGPSYFPGIFLDHDDHPAPDKKAPDPPSRLFSSRRTSWPWLGPGNPWVKSPHKQTSLSVPWIRLDVFFFGQTWGKAIGSWAQVGYPRIR